MTIEIWRHADDLGATEGISEGILTAWQAGWLDGFSIFANGEASALVRQRLAHTDRPARARVHLNLSEGPPTLPPDQVPLLVDGRGQLKLGFGELWRALKRPGAAALLAQVRREWHAQIEAVREVVGDRVLAGVDGHIHVHALPPLFRIAAELAVDHGLAGIRVPRESAYVASDVRAGWSSLRQANALKHLALRRYAGRNQRTAQRLGLRHADRFVGLLYSGAMTPESVRAGILAAERRGARTVEVLFHPGRARPDERSRWAGRSALARYPTSVDRDRERQTLQILYGEVG